MSHLFSRLNSFHYLEYSMISDFSKKDIISEYLIFFLRNVLFPSV